ncbi:TIGR00730 family Rossman fold protein [Glutamicibacter endophyticus]
MQTPDFPRSVTVFTGSATGASAIYAEATTELARALAEQGVEIVYGGGHVGLMGTLADAALEAGGRVRGVMPQSLLDGEIAHPGLSELDIVADMHERKQRMAERAEAFIALPGGAGTLEEFFEVWTWQQLGLHRKPVALYDVNGFWQPLLSMIEHFVAEGFLAERYRQALIVVQTPAELLAALQQWAPAPAKW